MFAQLLIVGLSIWLLAAPDVLDYLGSNAGWVDRAIAPLAAGFATIACWPACRPCRWVNLLLGMTLLVAALVGGYPRIAIVNSCLVGLALMLLAPRGGRADAHLGGGWKALTAPPSENL
jgi:hypothetical protein